MSQPTTPSTRLASVVLALVLVAVVCGYCVGKQMALRDNARAVPTAGS